MFRFMQPWVGLCLIPLWLWCLAMRAKNPPAFAFSHLGLLEAEKDLKARSPEFILRVLVCLGLSFLLLAWARPQAGETINQRSQEGIDMILAIDTSESMRAMDFSIKGQSVDRLTVIQSVVKEFIGRRQDDRIGLVIFGSEAFTHCPLTYDLNSVESLVDELKIGMAGSGTAIGSALGVAINRLRKLDAKEKVVVLLTDGSNNSGIMSPQKAAELAEQFGIKVYTIGVGTRGEAPVPQDTVFGRRYVYQKVDIDEDTLKLIADKTQGKYFRATDTASLSEIYAEIDKLEKRRSEARNFVLYDEWYRPFALAGLICLGLFLFLREGPLRVLP